MDDLLIAEVFGPTFQGEGPSLGRRAGFVRLSGCNLACVWCDTPYTWDWSRFDPKAESRRLGIPAIIAQLVPMAPQVVVITGGEPLLQQAKVADLAYACAARGWPTEVETNGTILPAMNIGRAITRWNVSPKLAHAGGTNAERINWPALEKLRDLRSAFKFVCQSPADLDEVNAIVVGAQLSPYQVWVMAEGRDAATVAGRTGELAAAALERGYNLTTRLQILLWGDQRGK